MYGRWGYLTQHDHESMGTKHPCYHYRLDDMISPIMCSSRRFCGVRTIPSFDRYSPQLFAHPSSSCCWAHLFLHGHPPLFKPKDWWCDFCTSLYKYSRSSQQVSRNTST